jgi:cytochrome c biogenesis protein CcmG, thiol:disulfide interchange protein DsbE
MNSSRIKIVALATLLAGVWFSAQAALKIGDAFPDLAGFQLKGQPPGALKGKVVIVDFWASWCGPCKESFPAMNALKKNTATRAW